jgi:hypothetical protein
VHYRRCSLRGVNNIGVRCAEGRVVDQVVGIIIGLGAILTRAFTHACLSYPMAATRIKHTISTLSGGI